MKCTIIFKSTVLLFFCNVLNAQVAGQIFNESDSNPIPYVSIWVNNGYAGTTADENGNFKIEKTDRESKLIFGAVGFKKKTIEIGRINDSVFLEPEIYALPEISIYRNRKISVKLGKLKNSSVLYAVTPDYSKRIMGRYFSNDVKHEQQLFVKSVRIRTQTTLDASILNLQFYAVEQDSGEPKNLLHNENILFPIKKGNNTTEIDVSTLNIEFPASGMFVAFENLLLDQNQYEILYKSNAGELRTVIIYEPRIKMLDAGENKDTWWYNGKKWTRNEHQTISMEVVLSN